MILDPLHYLATLGRKPGALDHAPVFRDWKLPACFADFRAELERHHGAMAGARRFVRVLQLLGEHPHVARESRRSRPAGASNSTVPRPSSSGRESLAAIEAADASGGPPPTSEPVRDPRSTSRCPT